MGRKTITVIKPAAKFQLKSEDGVAGWKSSQGKFLSVLNEP